VVSGRRVVAGVCLLKKGLSTADKDVSRKFETCAQFPHLFQREFPLPRQKHGDGAFRSEFRDQIALGEALVFEEKSDNRNRVRSRDRIVFSS
jgi:hypothetical protein